METKLATYNHDGLKLDLFGFLYNDGFEVTSATAGGKLAECDLESMTEWCNQVLVPDWSMMTRDE